MERGRIKLLRKWSEIAAKVAAAVKTVYPKAEVYVIGGAAEGRLTVLSDIDVAVVFKEGIPGDRAEILANVWEALDAHGVPMYYPVEIHILDTEEFRKVKSKKIKIA